MSSDPIIDIGPVDLTAGDHILSLMGKILVLDNGLNVF